MYSYIFLVNLLNPVINASCTFLSHPDHVGAPVAPRAYKTPRSHFGFIRVAQQECLPVDHILCDIDMIYHLACSVWESERERVWLDQQHQQTHCHISTTDLYLVSSNSVALSCMRILIGFEVAMLPFLQNSWIICMSLYTRSLMMLQKDIRELPKPRGPVRRELEYYLCIVCDTVVFQVHILTLA